jgi:hypothetical protein
MEVASNLIGAPTNRAVLRDRNGVVQIQKAANSKSCKFKELENSGKDMFKCFSYEIAPATQSDVCS